MRTFRAPKTSDAFVEGFRWLMHRERAGDGQCSCSALGSLLPLPAWHTEGTSTRVCLSPVETDAARAAVQVGLSRGQEGALSSWPESAWSRPPAPGTGRAGPSQTSCRSSLDGRFHSVCVGVCVRVSCPPCCNNPLGYPVGPGARGPGLFSVPTSAGGIFFLCPFPYRVPWVADVGRHLPSPRTNKDPPTFS